MRIYLDSPNPIDPLTMREMSPIDFTLRKGDFFINISLTKQL
jgi:hypothetical protein